MATIGVLTYTLPAGLMLKNSINKIAINNNNNNNNNNSNNINNNNNNNNAESSEIVLIRKKQKLVPLLESKIVNVQSITSKKHSLQIEQSVSNIVRPISNKNILSSGGKKTTPQPQAVARRNARERNRVKQVNNGFAALRRHIPDEIAEAFEAAGNGRGSNKKLSKVETLRMAVEYIRSLERQLDLDITNTEQSDGCSSTNTSINHLQNSVTVIKSESCSSSMIDDQGSDSNYDGDESAIYYSDNLPDITSVNGLQYLRIPGTNTYQLIMPDTFENEENIQPLPIVQYNTSNTSPYNSYSITTVVSDNIIPSIPPATLTSSYNSYTSNNNSCSTTISPAPGIPVNLQQAQLVTSGMQMEQQIEIKSETSASIVYHHHSQNLAPNSSPISDDPCLVDAHMYDEVISLKRSVKEEDIVLDASVLSEESMIGTIDWWDQQTPPSDDCS